MEILDKINNKIATAEGSMIASLWKCPDLYSEYNIKTETLSEDGIFYYALGERMYGNGSVVFNEVSVYDMISENKDLLARWELLGGWKTVQEMQTVVDIKNFDSYFNSYSKWHYIKYLHSKGFNVETDFIKFEGMTSEQVYNYFEYLLNDSNIETVSNLDFEDLDLTDEELDSLLSGENIGLQYSKYSPILNNLTLGLSKGNLHSINSYINEGKTSFVVANVLTGILEAGHKCLIISNEMVSREYKQLLIIHVLTRKMNYYQVTRRKLKSGKLNEEELAKINEAREYIKEHYSGKLKFIKIFDYSLSVVNKSIKKYSALGFEFFMFDVLKAIDLDKGWQELVENSKELFKLASKLDVCILTTMQLAMATKGKSRKMGMETLSNAKQVAEVQSTIINFRKLWDDEKRSDGKYFCKPYKLMKNPITGKYTGIKEEIELKPDGDYSVFIISKSRDGGVGDCVLYEKELHINKWNEIGYCTIVDENKY